MDPNLTIQSFEVNDDTAMHALASLGQVATASTVIDTVADSAMIDDEEMRSEASFRFRVENFSKLKDSVLSPPCSKFTMENNGYA